MIVHLIKVAILSNVKIHVILEAHVDQMLNAPLTFINLNASVHKALLAIHC